MAEEIAIDLIINVSRSAKSVKEVNDSLKDLNLALGKVDDGSESFKQLSKQIEASEKMAADFAITSKKANLTLKELAQTSEILNKELENVDRSSERFKILQAAVIDVNKEIKNTELSLTALNREDVASAFGQLTGAAGSLTGAFVLLGGEGNETIEQIGQNLQRAIGITQAFQGSIEAVSASSKLWRNFSGIIKSNSTITKIATVVQTGFNKVQSAFGKTVDTSSKALNGFKNAIIATGVGALIVAIGLLIANFDKIKAALSGVSAEQKLVNDAREKAIDSAAEELLVLDDLHETINSGNISREDQVKAVKKIQEQYPGLLSNINAETVTLEELNKAIKLNSQLVLLQAESQAIAELRTEARKTILKEELSIQTETNTGILTYIASNVALRDEQELANSQSQANISQARKETALLDERNDIVQESIDLLSEQLGVDQDSIDARKEAEDAQKKADAAAKAASSERKRLRDKEIADEKKRLIDLDKFEEEVFQSTLDNEEDLLARKLTLQFEANVERAKTLVKDEEQLNRLLTTINEEFFEDLVDLEDRFIKIEDDKALKVLNINKKTKDALDILEQEQALVNAENVDDEIEREEEKSKVLIELNEAKIQQLRTNEEIALQNTELTESQRLEITKSTELEISKIKQDQRDINKEKDQEELEGRKELNEQLIASGFEVIQMIADAAFEIAQEARNREFEVRAKLIQDNFDFEADQNQRRVELGVQTQKIANKQLAKLEKDKRDLEDKLNEEQFDRDKKTKLSQAFINGALAITQIFATTPPPASFILAGVQAISTGVSVAKIKSQKFTDGGILRGPSHAGGGVDLGNGNEGEGGEVIINKNSSRIFRNELSAINEAGGGVKFARGGILPTQAAINADGSEVNKTLQDLNRTLSKPIKAFVVGQEVEDHLISEQKIRTNADL